MIAQAWTAYLSSPKALVVWDGDKVVCWITEINKWTPTTGGEKCYSTYRNLSELR